MNRSTQIFVLYVIVAFVVQAVMGSFPAGAFEFPVNAAVLFAWVTAIWILHSEFPSCALSRWLSSGRTSVLLICCLLLCCLLCGCIRQTGVAGSFLGLRDIVHTWWFAALLLALMSNLLMVIFSRPFDFRFFLNHTGLLLALAGGFFGAPDTSISRAAVYMDTPSRAAYLKDGTATALRYEISMDRFAVENDGNGNVSSYSADVTVDGKSADIRVNHPYRRNAFEDIYLVGYDTEGAEPRYCILEIVRQPWKYALWVGIVMMMAGSVLLFLRGAGRRGRAAQ